MQRILLIAAGVMTLSSAAYAGSTNSSYNWTGCYVGANAGYGWGSFQYPPGSNTLTPRTEGFVGGGQVGCDSQLSNWVFGLQADLSGADMKKSATTNLSPGLDATTANRIDWLASATGRLGYAWGPSMIYGKGGAAWMGEKIDNFGSGIGTSSSFSTSPTRFGWTLGGGYEYKFSPSLSFFVEYDYYGFGTKTYGLSGTACNIGVCSPSSETLQIKQDVSLAKIGINYRFGTQ